MVMPLPRPAVCSVQLVADVVAERQGGKNAGYFNEISAEWVARVTQYINNAGSPEFVPKWPEIDDKKKTFLNLYLHAADDSVQGHMLDLLRDHDLDLCPACGEAGRPNTLDHYLPKGLYPHFCITPLNLFPMCDKCQNEKLEKTGNAINRRFFIHPYFDTFITQQVIRLVIDPPFDKPAFRLEPAQNLTPDQKALVETHVRELGIEKRYLKFFKCEHRRLLRLVGKMRSSNQNIVENLHNFQFKASDPTPNSWEHVFYSAVLGNQELLDYLNNAGLPAYL